MAYNENVGNAVRIMMDTYRTDKYNEAYENYFKVLEEEIIKGLGDINLWIDLEDHVDFLYDSILNEDPAELISEVLTDYIRFWELREKYNLGKRDQELIDLAEEYIKNHQ